MEPVNYLILRLVNRGTVLNPIWEVYGYESETANKCLLEASTYQCAGDYAFSVGRMYNLPVFCGSDMDFMTLLRAICASKAKGAA